MSSPEESMAIDGLAECACGESRPFLGIEYCRNCLRIESLERGAALVRIDEWEAERTARFQELVDGPVHPLEVLGALILAGELATDARPDLVVMNDRMWVVLSLLAHHALETDVTVHYGGRIVTNGRLAVDIATLRDLQFRVSSGESELVVGASIPGAPQFGFGPEVPLHTAEAYWMSMTRVPFGQIPGYLKGRPEIQRWFQEDDSKGSFLAMLKGHDVPIAPAFASFQRQMYKAWAPWLIRSLATMNQARLESIATLLAWLQTNGTERFLEGDRDGSMPFWEVSVADAFAAAAQLPDPAALSALVVGAGSAPTLPTLVQNGIVFGYSKKVIRAYQFVVGGYRRGPSGRQIIEQAGDVFERLVSKVVSSAGLTTVSETELVNVSRAKKANPDEIDVVAIRGDDVFLIECKAEMDPPGAWTPEGRLTRVEQLRRHMDKLGPKVERWQRHLESGRPVRHDQAVVDLPVDPGKVQVHGMMVSMRPEPRADFLLPLVTLWPQKAAEFASEHFPQAAIAPMMGPEDLVAKVKEIAGA